MNILFINPSGEGAYLPHIPPGFEISGGCEVEEVATLDGIITLPNNRTLRSFNISAMFPTKQYSWINKNANLKGWDYVRYFNECIDNVDVIKVYVISDTGNTILYMKCTIESFSYNIDRVGDIIYSLTVKEHRAIDPKKVAKV